MRTPKPLIRAFLIGLFLLQSMTTMGAGKIALLTSLDPEENRPPLRFRSWNINEKLEDKFWRYYPEKRANLEPEIIHFADQFTLYSVLQDPQYKAVIWIGHAGFGEDQGMSAFRSVIDHQGLDLKNVFQAVGPHLKYLALVGCRGKLFLEEWKEKGWFSQSPELKTYGREIRTDARKGLRKALKNLKKLLKDDPNLFESENQTQLDSSNTFEVQIERVPFLDDDDEKMGAVQILQRDQIVTVLPEAESYQSATILLNKGTHPEDFKIILDSGAAATYQEKLSLGRLILSSPDAGGSWHLFKTRSGKPIGLGKHIYQFKLNQESHTPR